MGGLGSGGGWIRRSFRQKVERATSLDIRYLKSQGMLQPYSNGGLRWHCGDESFGTMAFQTSQENIVLSYRLGDKEQARTETIQFSTTPCHFGGERKWFDCPSCRKRVGTLYLAYEGFRCRTCSRLHYICQSECKINRAIRAMHKLNERMYDANGIRKGMHLSTYERLNRRYEALDRQVDSWINILAGRAG